MRHFTLTISSGKLAFLTAVWIKFLSREFCVGDWNG